MAKVKVYEIAKELNRNTRQLMGKMKESHEQINKHIDAMKALEVKLIEEAKRKENESLQEKQKMMMESKRGEVKLDTVETTNNKVHPIPQGKEAESSTVQMSSVNHKNIEQSNSDTQKHSLKTNQDNTIEKENNNLQRNFPKKTREVAKQPIKENAATNHNSFHNSQTKENENQQKNPDSKRNGQTREHIQRSSIPQQRSVNGENSSKGYQNSKENKNNREKEDTRTSRRKPPIDKIISAEIVPPVEKEKVSNYDPNKNNYSRNYEAEKKPKLKKSNTKSTNKSVDLDDDQPKGSRKPKYKRNVPKVPTKTIEPIKIEKAVITSETVTVKELAEKIGKPASEIIKKLLVLGTIVTINQEIDYDTAELVSAEFGITLEQKLEKTYEEVLIDEDKEDRPQDLIERSPVVTIMGHVDHGKTSLLDAIRKTKVTEQEAGGITQHIGAYTIEINNRNITFLDTPGHEAFTAMRARGAQATDIAILVVAADDGVMPQTIEAINHAKAADVPIIVAINKIDKIGVNPERVKQELTEYGLVAEEWGGDTIFAPVSAITKEGIDHLLEMILLVAELQELKANPDRTAKGIIIEAQLDKGRGPVATVLVQNGTLKVGDTIVAGTSYGRVRAMMDDKGLRVNSAGPSQPVEVLGFSEVPEAGDLLYAVEDDKLSRQVAEERKDKIKAQQLKAMARVSLDDLFNQIAEGQVKDLNIIVKADVQGSVEAVKQALEKLSNDQVRVKAIHGGVGAITETDVMLASASNAIIIGFNVRPDTMARTAAEREKVDLRLYRIIYNAIEDIEKAMKGLLEPEFKEVVLGHAEVRATFKVSGVGTIAGCYVTDGKILRNANTRLVRDGIVVHEGKIDSLKRFKDDAREVVSGYECGIGLEKYNDIKEGDIIEAFIEEQVEK